MVTSLMTHLAVPVREAATQLIDLLSEAGWARGMRLRLTRAGGVRLDWPGGRRLHYAGSLSYVVVERAPAASTTREAAAQIRLMMPMALSGGTLATFEQCRMRSDELPQRLRDILTHLGLYERFISLA
jgi:hypothetical protein